MALGVHPHADVQSKPLETGVIRIGKKGMRKFAFGDDKPFEVDVVVAFQTWINLDDEFRPEQPDADGRRPISNENVPRWHAAAVDMVKSLSGNENLVITVAEALDFIARLREEYDAVADFFVPRSPKKPDSPDTSAPVLSFSEEES